MSSTNSVSKKKIKKLTNTHKQSKKRIEQKLNTILLSLDNQLRYDLSVDDEFKSSILEKDLRVNLDTIHKLPTYNIEFNTKHDDDDHNDKKSRKRIIDNKVSSSFEDDEYIKSLTIEKVGNIMYRFDYDKGIIYDMKMNEVGHIDDCGDICILNDNSNNENQEENDDQDETI
jgi:hypothetical protein